MPQFEETGTDEKTTRIAYSVTLPGFQKRSLMSVFHRADGIQASWSRGRFYSERQLIRHADFIVRGAVLDIGANAGNHTVFYANYTQASRIVPFEPNPVAIDVLRENVRLNNCGHVDLSHVGIAVGREAGKVSIGGVKMTNIGATSVSEAEDGDVPLRTVDSFGFEEVCFMKIDVEGMEFDVLAGARETIRTSKPVIAIEIRRANVKAFFAWCEDNDYFIVDAFRAHPPCFDYVCIPAF